MYHSCTHLCAFGCVFVRTLQGCTDFFCGRGEPGFLAVVRINFHRHVRRCVSHEVLDLLDVEASLEQPGTVGILSVRMMSFWISHPAEPVSARRTLSALSSLTRSVMPPKTALVRSVGSSLRIMLSRSWAAIRQSPPSSKRERFTQMRR